MSFFHWLSHAIRDVSRAVSHVAKDVAHTVEDVGHAIGKVPLIGALSSIAMGPFDLAVHIGRGERIDRALLHHFEQDLKSVKDVGPYAQMVLSVVPGIGTGINAAIAAGVALASGQRIDKALEAAITAAIPGGPIAKAAFDIGKGIADHRPLEQIAIGALPIPETIKEGLKTAATLTRALASGKPIDAALLSVAEGTLKTVLPMAQVDKFLKQGPAGIINGFVTSAQKALPADIQKAFGNAIKVGAAIGHATALQNHIDAGLRMSQNHFFRMGMAAIRKNATLSAAFAMLPQSQAQGFAIANAFLMHKVNLFQAQAQRAMLDDHGKKAFDSALSLHAGLARMPRRMWLSSPHARAAQAMTHGLVGAHPAQKTAVLLPVLKHPQGRKGASHAIATITGKRPHESTWWESLLSLIGLGPSHA